MYYCSLGPIIDLTFGKLGDKHEATGFGWKQVGLLQYIKQREVMIVSASRQLFSTNLFRLYRILLDQQFQTTTQLQARYHAFNASFLCKGAFTLSSKVLS